MENGKEEKRMTRAEHMATDEQFWVFCRELHAQGVGKQSILKMADFIKESESFKEGKPTLKAVERANAALEKSVVEALCTDPRTMSVDPELFPVIKKHIDRLESLLHDLKNPPKKKEPS